MLFTSKPSTIEAVQWTGDNDADMHAFGEGKVRVSATLGSEHDPSLKSLELLAGKDGAQEWVPVPVGHWLVNQPGDKSDIWPVDPDYFAAKYQYQSAGDGTTVDPKACPKAVHQGERPAFSFKQLSPTGVLWLINRAVFHPRGFALAIEYEDGTDEPFGWSLQGDGSETWRFEGFDEDERFSAVEALFAQARRFGKAPHFVAGEVSSEDPAGG